MMLHPSKALNLHKESSIVYCIVVITAYNLALKACELDGVGDSNGILRADDAEEGLRKGTGHVSIHFT